MCTYEFFPLEDKVRKRMKNFWVNQLIRILINKIPIAGWNNTFHNLYHNFKPKVRLNKLPITAIENQANPKKIKNIFATNK